MASGVVFVCGLWLVWLLRLWVSDCVCCICLCVFGFLGRFGVLVLGLLVMVAVCCGVGMCFV